MCLRCRWQPRGPSFWHHTFWHYTFSVSIQRRTEPKTPHHGDRARHQFFNMLQEPAHRARAEPSTPATYTSPPCNCKNAIPHPSPHPVTHPKTPPEAPKSPNNNTSPHCPVSRQFAILFCSLILQKSLDQPSAFGRSAWRFQRRHSNEAQ